MTETAQIGDPAPAAPKADADAKAPPEPPAAEPSPLPEPSPSAPGAAPAEPVASLGDAPTLQPAAWRSAEVWLADARSLLVRALPSVEDVRGHLSRLAPRLRLTLPSLRAYLSLVLQGAAIVAAGLVAIVLTLLVVYRWVNPPASTLMLGQRLSGTSIERTWVPLERISPYLIKAVILSEDGAFCRHRGVDWSAIRQAIESERGGSTITMQVVKNLFLWPSRSYVRKAIEIGLAYLADALWPKRRILEIYLNIAEWGDGVFGAEAAARTHFGKRAARLTAQEAALLAVTLPNPIERTAGAPSLMTSRLAGRLMVRMATSRGDLSCVRTPRPEPKLAPRAAPRPAPKLEWDHLFPAPD